MLFLAALASWRFKLPLFLFLSGLFTEEKSLENVAHKLLNAFLGGLGVLAVQIAVVPVFVGTF
jgi:hypothetical protein